MKVLWFEITIPSGYSETNNVLGGWQDALEAVVRRSDCVDLYVAFLSPKNCARRENAGVKYIPIIEKYGLFDKIRNLFSWDVCKRLVLNRGKKIVDEVNPDIIHVFGTEFPFGLLSKFVKIPVVLHIQGAIIPYYNAGYPPRYNGYTMVSNLAPNFIWQLYVWVKRKKELSRLRMEREIWKSVNYYMGRTEWDKAVSSLLSENSSYFHIEEMLRPIFYNQSFRWKYKCSDKIHLVSIGIGTFWKGPDVILKTASILCEFGIDFEWSIAGNIRSEIKKVVEKEERKRFCDNNVIILGNLRPVDLSSLLVNSSIYVHAAYIDNSPNAICEAQMLGIPIISTYVGGIDSLIRNNKDGILVPANDPWRMAYTIINLAKDSKKMVFLSENAKERAKKRHNEEKILSDVLSCYNSILRKA